MNPTTSDLAHLHDVQLDAEPWPGVNHRATCACGWRSSRCITRDDAILTARGHLIDVGKESVLHGPARLTREPDVYTYAASGHECQLCEPRP
jgi:hypothetical protein